MEPTFAIKVKNGKKYFYRFSLNQRFQHMVLFTTVITLVLTGMPLRYPSAAWAQKIYAYFGGIQYAPVVHRVAGTILLLLFVYHIGYLVYTFYHYQMVPLLKKKELTPKRFVWLIIEQPLMPNLKDVKDIIQLLKYYLFLTNERPRGDMFTWKEKFDYWAPFWGIVIIGTSGVMMWHKEWFTRFLPGEVLNYALIAHSEEALLAALFLFIWHFYNVHFSTSVFPMGTQFLTGYLTEELMVEEHYAYYVAVMKKAGLENEILPPPESDRPKFDRPLGDAAKVSLSELPRV
jgi:cytochrome b subunit of formate dehydrogenase